MYKNDGSENFTKINIATVNVPYSVYPCDLDSDGDLDILTSAWFDDIAWIENTGNDNFTKNDIIPANDQIFNNHACDLDGDGDLDAFEAINGAANRIWTNDGNGVFTAGSTIGTFAGTKDIDVGDVDGDGVSDLAVGAYLDDDGGLDRGAVWILPGGPGM